MAFTTNPTVQIILFFKDDDLAESKHSISVPISLLSYAVGFAVEYAALFSAISSCALWKIHVTSVFKNDSPTPNPGSDVFRRSMLLFSTEENQIYVLDIPGMVASKLLTVGPYAGVQLDVGDLDMAALISLMTNGNGAVRPVAPWNINNGGSNEWDWSGIPLSGIVTAYWGYEQPGWH